MNNDMTVIRVMATFATASLLASVVLVSLYLLKLPIFDQDTLAWCLFSSIVAAGAGVFALIARGIWDK